MLDTYFRIEKLYTIEFVLTNPSQEMIFAEIFLLLSQGPPTGPFSDAPSASDGLGSDDVGPYRPSSLMRSSEIGV